MASTQDPTFGQYIATQPLDKFNCGQEYIFELDDSLVPPFGGMTRAAFSLNSNGLCPNVEDYNTFEIAPVPPLGSGAPPLVSNFTQFVDEEILLYINAQYPSINGQGVDFGNSANIDTYELTIISPLPETSNINDVQVYVLNNNDVWTTNGISIESRELIQIGITQYVQLEVITSYLGQFVVGGKLLAENEPGRKSGFGNTGVGPTSERKSKTGGDLSGAKIHRVSYDVCNENISRILVGHDRPVPPVLQLVSPQLGLVEATLSEYQPYAQQSRHDEISRYLYEAPLGSGETDTSQYLQ